MSTQVLIDNFTGDPEAFYALVVDEINQRALPDLKYDWVEEAESDKRFFNKGEKLRALQISFKANWMVVFAYQLGACFFVSNRVTTQYDKPPQSAYLYDVKIYIFGQVVERATKKALARHMEERGSAIPSFLAVNDNFPVSQQSTS